MLSIQSNCFAQKDSSNKFINKFFLNLLVIPNYVNSFDNNITFHTKDYTKNVGQGIRFGITAEYKFTKRSALRLGIYHYNEASNFEIFQDMAVNPFEGAVFGRSYFARIKQAGIEFPIEYKCTFINKYEKIKIYFVTGLIFSYFYKQDKIIINNGSPLIK